MRGSNAVTKDYLRGFKTGDLVDVRDVRRKYGLWAGPYKILGYKLNPPVKGTTLTAQIEIDLGQGRKFKRWLLTGDQQVIRRHIPEISGKSQSLKCTFARM